MKHKIGLHGAVGMLVRKGNKVVRICTECGKEIKYTEHKKFLGIDQGGKGVWSKSIEIKDCGGIEIR